MRPASLAIAVLSLLCATISARAADPVEVEALIQQGNGLRKAGRDQEALAIFKRAYEIGRSPRTAAQLGLVELSLGYAVPAEAHLGEALSAANHLWVIRNRADLEAALAQARLGVGTLEIAGAPAGAQIAVNGQVVGIAPLAPVRLAEGLAALSVRADGREIYQRTVQIAGGRRDLVVVPTPVAPAPPRPPPVRATDVAPPARPGWARPVGWTASALAAVALGLGGYGLVRVDERADTFNSLKVPGTSDRACSTSAPGRGDPRCAPAYAEVRSAERLTRVAFGAAGLLAGVALAGFLWPDHAEAGPRAGVDAGALVAGWRGRF